jgi:hypothetical protein
MILLILVTFIQITDVICLLYLLPDNVFGPPWASTMLLAQLFVLALGIAMLVWNRRKNKMKKLAWIMTIVATITPSIIYPLRQIVTESYWETFAAAKLDHLIFGCRSYAEQHDGQYPPSISELIHEGFIKKSDLSCRFLGAPPELLDHVGDGSTDGLVGRTDFVYLGAGLETEFTSRHAQNIVLFYSEELFSWRKGRLVGFADGSVINVSNKDMTLFLDISNELLNERTKK